MERDKWQTLIDQQIRQAQESGQFRDLPGTGKPLKLDEDAYTPADLRLAHKLLKDNGFAPDWMMQGKELDDRRARLLANVQKAARAYRVALADAERDAAQGATRRQQAEAAWGAALETFQAVAAKLNKEITSYNLKIPAGVTHKSVLSLDHELRKLLG